MPLMMFCGCGHSALLPETSGKFKCSKCGTTLALNWFDGKDPLEKFRQDQVRHAVFASAPAAQTRIEFVTSPERAKE